MTTAPRVRFLICNNAPNLQAAAPDVTVEAEYGDLVATGALLTMAHHGPRAGGMAPCAYPNDCAPEARTVGLSHVDLDTVGGCMAVLGIKPKASGFWRVAEHVDLNGAHKVQLAEPAPLDLRRLNAYWVFAKSHPVYAPRDGSVLDVTDLVLKHVCMVESILTGGEDFDELLAAGDAHAEAEAALNRASFMSLHGDVIVRRSSAFVNHLYATPDGEPALAVVSWNPSQDVPNGAITVSLADPVCGVDMAKIMRANFGPEAGGHAGIAGSPRGKPLPESDAWLVANAIVCALVDAGQGWVHDALEERRAKEEQLDEAEAS
jgi:hypothetical protein